MTAAEVPVFGMATTLSSGAGQHDVTRDPPILVTGPPTAEDSPFIIYLGEPLVLMANWPQIHI